MSANEVNLKEAVPSMHSKLHIRQLDREEKNAGWHSGMSEIGAGDVGAEFGQYLTAPKPQPWALHHQVQPIA